MCLSLACLTRATVLQAKSMIGVRYGAIDKYSINGINTSTVKVFP